MWSEHFLRVNSVRTNVALFMRRLFEFYNFISSLDWKCSQDKDDAPHLALSAWCGSGGFVHPCSTLPTRRLFFTTFLSLADPLSHKGVSGEPLTDHVEVGFPSRKYDIFQSLVVVLLINCFNSGHF